MQTVPHPSVERLTAYLRGRLSLPEKEEVQSHLRDCADCLRRIGSLEGRADSHISSLPGVAADTGSDAAQENSSAAARPRMQSTVDYGDAPSVKRVAGHELREELARGGLGVVFLAYHPILGEVRAIKRPQARDGSVGEHLLARFRREVRAVGALRHDHIIRAHDAGADDEGPYLVMEYLEGASLSDLLARHKRLPVPEACELVRQAALGLQAAHERGLVHRDVKPSNLMLARANSGARVVVIDWGLVKWTVDGPNGPTPMGEPTLPLTALGTPDYMAPEQARDAHTVDSRADIYSLGVTLYCLLAGKPPFHDRSPPDKLVAHTTATFPPLRRLRSDVSPELEAVLAKMVEKNLPRRYSTAGEAANALQSFCCPESCLLALLEGNNRPKPPPIPTPPLPPWWRSRHVRLLTGATGLLVIAVFLGLMLFRTGPKGTSEQQGADAALADSHGTSEELATTAVLGDGPVSPVSMKDSQPGHCTSLVFMPDGLRALSECGGGGVCVWDLQNRRKERWQPHAFEHPLDNAAGVVAVSPDGRLIAAAGLHSFPRVMMFLSLFDGKTYQRVNKDYHFFNGMGSALAFSPDSSKLAAVQLPGVFMQNPTVKVFDVQIYKNPRDYPSAVSVDSLAFSPDGRFLITGSEDKIIRLLNLKNGVQERDFRGHEAKVDQVAFSADGKRIFSASHGDGTLRVWNNDANERETGKEVKKAAIGNTEAKMACAAFWPRGRALTGHTDGHVILWDLATCSELKRFRVKEAPVTAVAISPDGHHALAALADHLVYLYRLPPPRAEP